MILWLILVAFFWGTSTPVLKRYSVQVPTDLPSASPIHHILSLFKRCVFFDHYVYLVHARWRFLAAYLYDQAGSMLYYYVLGQTDLSTAVPIANGLTFAVAGLTEALLDKRLPSRGTIEGSILILLGVYICFSTSTK